MSTFSLSVFHSDAQRVEDFQIHNHISGAALFARPFPTSVCRVQLAVRHIFQAP